MSFGQIVSTALAAVLLFWAIGAHNRLIALRNAIGAAWVQLDSLLKRRHALIESLLVVLRREIGESTHEFDAVLAASMQAAACASAVRARPSAAPAVASLSMAEGVYGGAMARLLGLLDAHADIARRDGVAPLIGELVEIETRLGFTRRAFNEAASAFNQAVRQFPTRLLSRLFGLRTAGRL